jgi:hypothetical protein
MKIKLTKFEAELIEDRAAMPDCMCDVFVHSGDFPEFTEDKICEACDYIASNVRGGKENKPQACILEVTTKAQIEVLVDCLEGCTWMGSSKYNISNQQRGMMLSRMYKLGEKLSKALDGRKISVPDY